MDFVFTYLYVQDLSSCLLLPLIWSTSSPFTIHHNHYLWKKKSVISTYQLWSDSVFDQKPWQNDRQMFRDSEMWWTYSLRFYFPFLDLEIHVHVHPHIHPSYPFCYTLATDPTVAQNQNTGVSIWAVYTWVSHAVMPLRGLVSVWKSVCATAISNISQPSVESGGRPSCAQQHTGRL